MGNVSVTLNLEGVPYTRELTLEQAGRILTFLGSQTTDVSDSTASSTAAISAAASSSSLEPQISPRELCLKMEVKTNMQKMLVFAWYIKSRQEKITSTALTQVFKMTGESLPGNLGRDLSRAVEDYGYLYLHDKKAGEYEITEKGNEIMKNGSFPEEKLKKKSEGGKKPSSTPTSPEVEALNISASPEGFTPMSACKTKRDKVVWLLAFAYSREIAGLTYRDIEFLSGKVRELVLVRDIHSLTKTAFQQGLLAEHNGKIEIQSKGIAYIRDLAKVETVQD